MANEKKTAPADVKDTAAKASAPAAAPKTEKKPAAKKETAPKTEKKPAAKKPAAAKKEAAPKAEKKPAAKKPAAKKPAAKKPAAKKTAAPKAAEKPARKGGKKNADPVETIIEAARKKIGGADISKIKYPIAVNFEVNGYDNNIFYAYISDSTTAVEHYKYDDYDVYIRADAEELLKVFTGKKNIYDAFADGFIKIDGNTKKAILFVNAAL